MQFDSQSLWLYLHFPTLQLDAIEQAQASMDPSASKKASQRARAIYQSSSNQLIQVNQAAFDQGLRIGMGLAKASMLHADLQLHEYNAASEESCIEHMAQKLYLITSDIALAPPQGLILRVQNMLHMYKSLDNYWRILRFCLADTGYQYHVASAYSIQAAKLLALHGKHLLSDQRQTITQALSECRLIVSDLDKKDIEKLARIGVNTLAELQALPSAEIANRVSKHSMQIINELRGQAPARVKFFQPATEFHDYLELLYEIDNSDKLLPVLAKSLNKLEHFLYVRNARAMRIGIDLYLRDSEAQSPTSNPLKLEFNSALPIYRRHAWLDIIALKLERVELSAPVHAVELHCLHYEITPISNDDLFAKKSQHIEGLSLISRLLNRLGEDKIAKLSFCADFRPERSSQLCSVDKVACQDKTHIQHDRPGILLEQPQALQQPLEVIKGPERIVSGWWDGAPLTRDYYIGEDDQGQQLWIFKTPENQWYVHGFFV